MKCEKEALVAMYRAGMTMQAVAEAHGCTRGYVSRVVKAAKVRTHRRKVRTRKCLKCGSRTKNRRYCSPWCYYQAIYNPNYVEWRHGQRAAVSVVLMAGYALQPGNVVHHRDSDNRNNARENLWVFRTHGDHMAFHRRRGIVKGREPVWRGDLVDASGKLGA